MIHKTTQLEKSHLSHPISVHEYPRELQGQCPGDRMSDLQSEWAGLAPLSLIMEIKWQTITCYFMKMGFVTEIPYGYFYLMW